MPVKIEITNSYFPAAMKKEEYTELGHYRLSKAQKKVVDEASKISGAKKASKARELLVDWAKNVVAEDRILTGRRK